MGNDTRRWPQRMMGVANSPARLQTRRSVEELAACFVVRDHNGQQLAYVYFEDEPGRRRIRVASKTRGHQTGQF
jgi:hypothetical protein